MKKLQETLKPFLSIIFGALLFLYYLNWLSFDGGVLAMGIIAVILSAYYVGIGVAGVVAGDKLPSKLRNAFDIASICSFPVFMFVYFLVITVNSADSMGPTGWVIVILSMVASLAMAVVYLISKLVKVDALKKLAFLFSAIFVLALLLDLLFDAAGNPISLGNFNIIGFVIYLVYVGMLMNSLAKANEPAKQAEQIEEIKEEKPEESKKE